MQAEQQADLCAVKTRLKVLSNLLEQLLLAASFVSTERQRRNAARRCCMPRCGRVSRGNQSSTASRESSALESFKQCTLTN